MATMAMVQGRLAGRVHKLDDGGGPRLPCWACGCVGVMLYKLRQMAGMGCGRLEAIVLFLTHVFFLANRSIGCVHVSSILSVEPSRKSSWPSSCLCARAHERRPLGVPELAHDTIGRAMPL